MFVINKLFTIFYIPADRGDNMVGVLGNCVIIGANFNVGGADKGVAGTEVCC